MIAWLGSRCGTGGTSTRPAPSPPRLDRPVVRLLDLVVPIGDVGALPGPRAIVGELPGPAPIVGGLPGPAAIVGGPAGPAAIATLPGGPGCAANPHVSQ
jgi:hypothetical protein